jgi:hypothetical protein
MYLSIIIGAFLFGAFFMAWRDEHRKLLSLESRLGTPEFRIDGRSEWWGTAEPDIPEPSNFLPMIVQGAVVNPHGPPSAILQWRMKLEFPNRTVIGDNASRPVSDLIIPLNRHPAPGASSKPVLVLSVKEWWPNATVSPVAAGGATVGWLMAFFKNVTPNDIEIDQPYLVVSFQDALTGKEHSFRKKIEHKWKGIRLPGE